MCGNSAEYGTEYGTAEYGTSTKIWNKHKLGASYVNVGIYIYII
jgi:hypothetical protein